MSNLESLSTSYSGGVSGNRIARVWNEFHAYWFPHVRDRAKCQAELADFYAHRGDYYEMIAGEDKVHHPQVVLLRSMVKPTDTIVDFGCGSGIVLASLAPCAQSAIGLDISELSIQAAAKRCPTDHVRLIQTDVAKVPLEDNCADVVYSLEVLEHVWDPETVLKEMIRVLKPGGLLFVTTPHGFSLDLHLARHRSIKMLHLLGAIVRQARTPIAARCFENTEPDIAAQPVYPDCDMITKMFAPALGGFLRRNGCAVERLETFFFQQAKAENEEERRHADRWAAHPFYRHFGDHILVVAKKKSRR